MESYKIEILNPKAKSLLKNLADLNLIRLKKDEKKSDFTDLITRLRAKSEESLSLEEIGSEVEKVRNSRYEKQKNHS